MAPRASRAVAQADASAANTPCRFSTVAESSGANLSRQIRNDLTLAYYREQPRIRPALDFNGVTGDGGPQATSPWHLLAGNYRTHSLSGTACRSGQSIVPV